MARNPISSINPVGREQRIDENFVELYATTGADGAAWTLATASATAAAGALTTYSAAMAYKQIGKTVHCQVVVAVTTVGTATLGLVVQLPVTPQTIFGQSLSVWRSGGGAGAASGLICATRTTGALADVTCNDGGNVAANGTTIVIGGTYEAA